MKIMRQTVGPMYHIVIRLPKWMATDRVVTLKIKRRSR